MNALNFTINFVGGTGASRAWRSARVLNGGTAAAPTFQTKKATLINVANAEMFLKFYTSKQTLLSNPRCVVPHYEWQIFKTGATTKIDPSLRSDLLDVRTYGQIIQQTLPTGLTDTQLTSSNIQLQSIPERIYIFVRRTRQNLTCCDTDS